MYTIRNILMFDSIIGAQWGDEGKGKVVNYFSKNYDWIIRYSGGNNAGHTLYYNDIKYVNHLLPSLHLESNNKGLLGPSMVIDIIQLYNEIKLLYEFNVTFPKRIYLDQEAFVILPFYKEIEKLFESQTNIGTTNRAIGPTYASKILRNGLRIIDLFEDFKDKCYCLIEQINNVYQLNLNFNDYESIIDDIINKFNSLLSEYKINIINGLDLKNEIINSNTLFEGAQGVLLDNEFGTFPYVTSSKTYDYNVGYHVQLNKIYGVIKPYVTRVGNGPFPTEIEDFEESDKIRKIGNEYGATTGRPRRIGWLDLPALKYASERSGITGLIITKTDILNNYGKLNICISYTNDNYPKNFKSFFHAKPVYVTIDSWRSLNCKNFFIFADLVKQITNLNIEYASFSPKTKDITRVKI